MPVKIKKTVLARNMTWCRVGYGNKRHVKIDSIGNLHTLCNLVPAHKNTAPADPKDICKQCLRHIEVKDT